MKKYYGWRKKGKPREPQLFPKPPYDYGNTPYTVVEENGKFSTLHADGPGTILLREIPCYRRLIRSGQWIEFPKNPFEKAV